MSVYSLMDEGQVFFDGRSIENFFYVIHPDLLNIPAMRDPVVDQLSNAEVEKSNATQINGKWFDINLLGKFLKRGDYRDPSGKQFSKLELQPLLDKLQIAYDQNTKPSKHIIIELISFFTNEIAVTIKQILLECKNPSKPFATFYPEFTAKFDDLWTHLKLCLSGLSLYNQLYVYTLCSASFRKVSDIRNLKNIELEQAFYCSEAIELVYESFGNLCTSASSSILRSRGKDEMCKMIARTKKTSCLAFNPDL